MELSDVGTKKFTTSYGDGWFPTFAKATDSEIFASLVSLSSDSAPYRLFNGLIISNVDFRRLLTLDMRSFDIRMTRDGYEKDNVKVCGIRQVSQLGTRSEQTIRGICDFQKEHTFSDEDVRFDIEPWDYQKTPWDTSSYCLRIMSPYVQDGDEMKTIKNEFHAVPLPPPQENNDPIYTGVYVSKISGEISAGIISDLTSFDNEEFQNRCKLSGFIPVSLLYLQHSEYSTESLTSSIRSGNNDIQEIYYYTRSPSFCKGKLNGPFEISGGYFVNCYYQQEQYISQMEPQEILSSYTSSFVWIEVDYSSEASATTQLTSGPLSAYNDSVMNPMKCVAPLYKFDNEGSVECDLRLIPHIQQWTDKSVISARV